MGAALSKRDEFSKATKRLAMERAGNRCECCDTDRGPFDHDHDIPCWKGGDNSLGNCVYLCAKRPGSCHAVKSAREEAEQAHHDRLAGRINAISGKPVKAQCHGTHDGRGAIQSRPDPWPPKGSRKLKGRPMRRVGT